MQVRPGDAVRAGQGRQSRADDGSLVCEVMGGNTPGTRPNVDDIDTKIDTLLGGVKRDIDISTKRRIFCNRNLKLGSIELIGWDMDYTLALYKQERLEQLSIDLTLRKLVANHG